MSIIKKFKNQSDSTKFFIVCGLLSVVILSLMTWIKVRSDHMGKLASLSSALGSPDTALVPVTVYTASQKPMKKSFQTQAFLLPWQEVAIRPNPLSLVRQVHAKVGDLVKPETILVSLNSEAQALRADLDKVESEMRNLDYAVTRILAQNSFLSKKEFKQRELEHRASAIRTRLGQLDNSAVIKSPIAGVVSELNLKVGDYVDQNGSNYMVRVIDKSKMRVQVFLPSNVAQSMTKETRILLSRDFDSSKARQTADAQLQALAPSVDIRTGTVFSEVALIKVPEAWWPGMYVTIEYILEEKLQALVIPKEAIVYENSKPYLFVVKSEERGLASTEATTPRDFVKKVEVEIGLKDQGFVEVVKGLEDLDQVVIQGQGALADNTKVDVIQ